MLRGPCCSAACRLLDSPAPSSRLGLSLASGRLARPTRTVPMTATRDALLLHRRPLTHSHRRPPPPRCCSLSLTQDVGWLKTVDEYYSGLNNTIQHAGVHHILDSTMDSLAKNPDRRFIYVEQAFFQRWWAEKDEETRAAVRTYVAEGRLEFINGGYCMPDEVRACVTLPILPRRANPLPLALQATTSYVDVVDQAQLGHRFIRAEFGSSAIPSVGWSIDPFGHSGVQASLLSSPSAGFSSLFVSRADFADLERRRATRSLEYVWTPSASLGPPASTFFSIMNLGLHLYFPLPGLCWDAVNCNDPEIQDDFLLDDYNVQDVVDRTVAAARSLQPAYVGDVYFTQGFDFNFEVRVGREEGPRGGGGGGA